MKVSIGNLNLNVVDTGRGDPALVFLHYWGGSARTWQRVMAALQGSCRCIAYDQRGWGASDAPPDGYELKDLADDASALIEALGLKRYVLIGHSMGGKIAQLLASRRLPGLEAMVLVAPASPFPQHLPEEARQAQIHAYDNRQTALDTIEFLTVRRPDEATVEQIIQDSLGGSPGAKRAWPTSAAYEDISSEVSKVAVPTLILVGDHDPQDPVEQQRCEVLPLIAHSRLEVVQDCGHLAPIEQPLALAQAIAAFLTEHFNQQTLLRAGAVGLCG